MGCYWVRIGCFTGLLGSALVSHAQEPVTPLHTFFQLNYDSAVIYQSGLKAQHGPHYLILAKQQGHVYFFTYINPYRNTAGRYFPGNLVRLFSEKEARFRATTPDTNQYFLPARVQPALLVAYWKQLTVRRLWAIQGDQQAELAASPKPCQVDDGDYNTFYLLDRRTMRAASFYAPAYFEECLGKNANRQQAIHARNIFHAVLRSSQDAMQ